MQVTQCRKKWQNYKIAKVINDLCNDHQCMLRPSGKRFVGIGYVYIKSPTTAPEITYELQWGNIILN